MLQDSPRSAESPSEEVAAAPLANEAAREPDVDQWPAVLRIGPHYVLAVTAFALVVAWVAFVAIDLYNFRGLGERLEWPMWHHLFNWRPVEWSQWFLLAAAILGAGFMAGRLYGTSHSNAAKFFLWFGGGLGLMLVEEAGDIRHVISWYGQEWFSPMPFDLHYQLVFDAPYFALLALVPIYAVLRYGRYAFRGPTVRPYFVAGIGLYALVGAGSAFRYFQDLYQHLGSFIDRVFFGGRFPSEPGMSQELAHIYIIDAPVEETLETLAAACVLAIVLAYVADLRARRLR